MLSLVLLASTALAWEGQPGLWLPGATSLGTKTGRAGVGVVFDEGREQLVLQGIVGVAPKLAINARGEVGDGNGELGLGLRYLAMNKEGFTLAPYSHFELGDHRTDAYLGLAGAVSGNAVGIDASLTLIGAHTTNGSGTLVLPPQALQWFEAGLTFHPARRQELRVGAIREDRFQLVATYRWHGEWWYVEPSILYWPDDLSARAQAGVRF